MFTLELDDNQKIVLFELLQALDKGIDEKRFNFDKAEQQLIWDLIADLEQELSEPFLEDYDLIVEKAKEALVSS